MQARQQKPHRFHDPERHMAPEPRLTSSKHHLDLGFPPHPSNITRNSTLRGTTLQTARSPPEGRQHLPHRHPSLLAAAHGSARRASRDRDRDQPDGPQRWPPRGAEETKRRHGDHDACLPPAEAGRTGPARAGGPFPGPPPTLRPRKNAPQTAEKLSTSSGPARRHTTPPLRAFTRRPLDPLPRQRSKPPRRARQGRQREPASCPGSPQPLKQGGGACAAPCAPPSPSARRVGACRGGRRERPARRPWPRLGNGESL